jgi:hypothetical protein
MKSMDYAQDLYELSRVVYELSCDYGKNVDEVLQDLTASIEECIKEYKSDENDFLVGICTSCSKINTPMCRYREREMQCPVVEAEFKEYFG